MAELSPNLGLNLPVGSDRFDYDKFLRQNFQILDDKVGKSTTEVLTATEGQTVFTLSNPYALGTDSLSVEVDGVKQALGSGYTETSTTSITFSEPLVAGAKVKVVILGLDQGQDNRLDTLTTSLSEKADKTDILLKGRNLVRNSDFESLPFIQSRSSIYAFTAGVTSPQYNDKKSLKIVVTNYEGSADPNKDFAIILTETMTSAETMTFSFWAYPSVSNKSIQVRMAYTGAGVQVNLGQANQWNKISFTLNLSDISKQNNYLYFNFQSSFTLHISDLQVSNKVVTVSDVPNSLNQVNDVLAESASQIHNSRGIIERLIDNAQTYLDNISTIVYGNSYTAYDPTQDLVGGKNQIDCSSFANLMVHGVPYNRSKYFSGNTQNTGSNLFFQNIDPVKWRYANNMAKYAFEKGYSFKPNADFSNLEPGDVLFFSWTNGISGDLAQEIRENAFMKIDHVGVFLHKKNETLWSTLQFDNGITTVYYEASNTYMSQCVLVARFPYANVESMYTDDNLILDGDTVKSITTGSTIGTYKLSEPLQKGKYYTLFLDGSILTDGQYFVVQTNTYATIHSDNGKVGPYPNGVIALRFPYLLEEVTNTIKISIGAPGGAPTDRTGAVNWCSLYKGYARSKRQYIKNYSYANVKDFPLDPALVSDITGSMAAYYKYGIDSNKLLINFNIPLGTLRTGTVVIGDMGTDKPKTTQRLPLNLVGSTNQAINGILQFSSSGTVSIIPYDGAVQWKHAIANGTIFRD